MKKTWSDLKWVSALYIGWRFLLFLFGYLVLLFLPVKSGLGYLASEAFPQGLPQFLTVWGNFDGVVFMRIAYGGYGAPEAPFFPFLPMIMAAGDAIGIPFVLTGLVFTSLATLGALWLVHQILDFDKQTLPAYSQVTFPLFVLTFLSFPTAFYLSSIYQDAFFLFFSCAMIWAVQRGRWWLAIAVSCVAMTARLNGLALLAYLGIEYVSLFLKSRENPWAWLSWPVYVWRAFWSMKWLKEHFFVWGFFCIPLTFALFLAYLDFKLGDWHVFFESVQVWHRNEITFPLRTFWRYIKILTLTDMHSLVYWIALAEAASTALYLGLLWRAWGKVRVSYWWWCLAHLMIPMITGTLQGMPRYGLQLYPIFLMLSAELAVQPKWVRWSVWIFFFGVQLCFASLFVRGFFVA